MQINIEELKALRKSLPHGACARIAKKLGCHRNNIYNVLNGNNKNDRIINELIAESLLVKEHEKKINAILKKIQ